MGLERQKRIVRGGWEGGNRGKATRGGRGRDFVTRVKGEKKEGDERGKIRTRK